MDNDFKDFADRVKRELYAAQTIYEQAERDRNQARKVLHEREEAFGLARIKVDACKTMLINEYEKEIGITK